MKKILPQNFFDRPVLAVARDLLGKYIVRKIGGKEIVVMITEVEAYNGFKDKASHASPVRGRLLHGLGKNGRIADLARASNGASRGKTERNKVMFGPAGCFYVYFTYGMHWMLNVVTGPKNYPAAVLIRGTKEVIGPARLTKFLKIDKIFNSKKAEPKTGLWFEDRGIAIKPQSIIKTERIGVVYAGPTWSKKKYRFLLR